MVYVWGLSDLNLMEADVEFLGQICVEDFGSLVVSLSAIFRGCSRVAGSERTEGSKLKALCSPGCLACAALGLEEGAASAGDCSKISYSMSFSITVLYHIYHKVCFAGSQIPDERKRLVHCILAFVRGPLVHEGSNWGPTT